MTSRKFSPSFSVRSVCTTSLALLVALGCGVESQGEDTGGVDLNNSGDQATRGFAVINTDYSSTSVSLLDLDGGVLSESFISSSSADPGLSAALSGDVVTSSAIQTEEELVLIDRSNSVLTWVNLESAEVRAQLSVGTGFASNPHDYVAVSETKAYVTRFAANGDSGNEDFDSGNDVLVIDPSVPEITGTIDLVPVLNGEEENLLPRADRAIFAGGKLRVLAIALSEDYSARAETRLVTIDPDTDEISHIAIIPDYTSCASLSLSPSGEELAIACNGAFGQDPADGFPDAGIVVYDTSDEPTEIGRYAAEEIGGEQIAAIDYASAESILFTTFGRYNDDRSAMDAPDTLRLLDLESDESSRPIVESQEMPFVLGDVRCVPKESICLATDAETEGGLVHLLDIEGSNATLRESSQVASALGLPPRYLGKY